MLRMKYIIANWKANKTFAEVQKWISTFLQHNFDNIKNSVHIVVCPPSPFIHYLYEETKSFDFISIGSQDVSQYEDGTYTGEVTAKSLSGLVSYAIIGHSERRSFFNETEELIKKKIDLAKKYSIEPILCVRNTSDTIYESVNFIVGEPPEAISDGSGKGKNLSLEKVLNMRNNLGITTQKYIYGGSVNETNITSYISNEHIDGILPGGASLDPDRFYSIVQQSV